MVVNLSLNDDPAYAAATAANKAAATAATYIKPSAADPTGGYDTRQLDLLRGDVVTPSMQVGSEIWMDTLFTGTEPTAAQKSLMTTADYEYAFAIAQLAQAKASGGKVNFAPQYLDKTGNLVAISQVTQAADNDFPLDPDIGLSADAGTGSSTLIQKTAKTVTDSVTNAAATASSYGIYIIAGVAIIFVVLVAMALRSGSPRGVPA